jgi:hypothetical protein
VKYEEFLSGKAKHGSDSGFDPVWMPDCAFDFQRSLIEWSVRKGRAAIFADCGLGKSLMSLAWAENVVRKTNKPVLLLAPLAVSQQFVGEGSKFGIDVRRQRDHGGTYGANVLVTNYEQLHHFSPTDFAGLVCDESSILKNFDGKIKGEVTEFARQIPYRLCCTATAAPNDFHELGTTSEALGYLGHRDMLTMFFKEDTAKDFLGWGRKTYRFRGHASQPFWRWVCSWARSCRKPSDLGFDDGRFVLPPLVERENVLETSTPRPGMLFSTPARDMREQRDERRATMDERCGVVASIVANHAAACKESPSSVVWCHLDAEAAQLLRAIPGAVEVSGSMSDEKKEERLTAFARGEIQTLVTKPKIGCYGLNWQHCCSVVTFPSHSFEQYYQAVRRCWRFGQTRPVTATVVTTEGEVGVLANLQRKARQSEEMFAQLVANMNNELKVSSVDKFSQKERLPKWL